MSRIKDIQMFMPSFFGIFIENGLAADGAFAKYKKITGPIVVSIETFEDLVRVSYRYDYPGFDFASFRSPQRTAVIGRFVRTGQRNITQYTLGLICL